jgi:Domain of unknown function (DUF1905)/Bacteriocin-protection, YdeI or OmpD-Associated
MKQRFEATLTARGPRDAWTFLPIPFDVAVVFGTKARVAVRGMINGFPFENSLMPQGDGTHVMPVSRDLQAGANAKPGDVVTVILERDTSERVAGVPDELVAEFRLHAVAEGAFTALAPSHKKEYADWVAGAKKAETRAARARKAIEMLAAGKKRLK